MKRARVLLALFPLVTAVTAVAHPGHEAPTVHAHDLDELLVMVAVTGVAAAIGIALRFARRARARRRVDER